MMHDPENTEYYNNIETDDDAPQGANDQDEEIFCTPVLVYDDNDDGYNDENGDH